MPSKRMSDILRRKRDYYESRGSDYLNEDSNISREESDLPTHNHDDRYFTKEQQNATQEIIDAKQLEQDGRLNTAEADIDTLQQDVLGKADSDHVHPVATTTDAGFMSAADKTKLNQAMTSAPVTSVNSKTGDVVLSNTDVGAAAASHSHVNATTNNAGFMSTTDKAKLDKIGTTFVHAYATAAQSIPANTTTKINFGAEKYDLNNEFTYSTGTFTCKTAGYYEVKCYYENNWISTAARMFLNLYKNGLEEATFAAAYVPVNISIALHGSAIVYLDVGDTLDVRVWSSAAFSNRARGENYDYVQVRRVF